MRANEDMSRVESEAGIIATLIHHPDFSFYSEQLLPNHFTNKENRIIYQALRSLAQSGVQTIDPYIIVQELQSKEATRRFADDLSVDQLYTLIENSDILCRDSVEAYMVLVNSVLDAAFRRDTYQKLKECMMLCTKDSETDLERKIYSAIDEVMTDYSAIDDVPEFKDVIDDLWKEVESHQDGKFAGIPFKFPTLNEYVRIEPGELVVVGAPAKGAKSMFMLNEAVDILKQGKSVFYLDSELSSRLFLCRLISHLTQIEFSRLRTGRYSEDDAAKIKTAIEWVKQQKLVHMYLPIFDRQTIYTSVKKVSHKFGNLDVLIVDYLKPTGSSTEAYTVYSELGNLTDLLKNELCGKLGIAGLAAAQLTSNNKIADSAKITRNASTIILMTDKSPEECAEDGDDSGNKKLVVAQNRNGMQHVDGEWINIDFHGNTCLLEEAKKQHYLEEPY